MLMVQYLHVPGLSGDCELCSRIPFQGIHSGQVEQLHLRRQESQRTVFRLWDVGLLMLFEFIFAKMPLCFMQWFLMGELFMMVVLQCLTGLVLYDRAFSLLFFVIFMFLYLEPKSIPSQNSPSLPSLFFAGFLGIVRYVLVVFSDVSCLRIHGVSAFTRRGLLFAGYILLVCVPARLNEDN
jgi:hypothetical protein